MAASLVLGSALIGAVLRIALIRRFASAPLISPKGLASVAGGVVLDVLVGVIVSSPVFLALGALHLRPLAHRWLRGLLFTAVFATQAFLAVVEYFYFEEFNARFNRIALDYVLFPHEVFVNVWESYPVALFVSACVGVGLAMSVVAMRLTRDLATDRWPWGARWRATLAAIVVAAMAFVSLRAVPSAIGSDRVLSEITENDLHQFVRAWSTADVDFNLYYRTLPPTEAHARAASVLELGHPRVQGRRATSHAASDGNPTPRPWDVVIVLEESFGSEFVGVLGHEDRRLTPGFDRWSREGVLLTNLVPTGNRTVRGLEGTLASFVPLPGDAIVKRDEIHGITTIASVLKARGYSTGFFYGGVGFFDHMKPFLTANGYDEFVEQSSYPDESFATAWGVADEYIFDAMLQRQVLAASRGERLFATLLTVSNHRPYDVPAERVDCSEGRSRRCAVRYADWALARYLDQASVAGLLEHTLVLVLGDHGARVYGSAQLPAASYRVPGLLLVPDVAWRGRRIERLCSQVDLAPSLLALLGVPEDPRFLGRDVTAPLPVTGGRAFVQHNRDVGLLTDTDLVVLSLQSKIEYYRRTDPSSDDFVEVAPDERLRALGKDAIAVYQTAYDLVHGALPVQRAAVSSD